MEAQGVEDSQLRGETGNRIGPTASLQARMQRASDTGSVCRCDRAMNSISYA
ncbi:MAG: hypothetical protein M3N53_06305 [Actinomycetota bacterium]|nr:hypothetical protein [Actinomycetota bacterium]